MKTLARWRIGLVLPLVVVALGTRLAAQEEGEEPTPEFRAGLAADYAAADGKTVRRLDPRLAFRWDAGSPDPRLPAGDFSARWKGKLFVPAPGTYRLHAHAAGSVKLSLAGETLLDSRSTDYDWHSAEPVRLEYGHHALEIEYQTPAAANGGPRGIVLCWEGPGFRVEVVPSRHLVCEPPDAPDDAFERGNVLVHALRCAACHEAPGVSEAPPAPSLARVAGAMQKPWLVDWLTQRRHAPLNVPAPPSKMPAEAPIDRRMPDFSLSRDEAAAIAEFLIARSEKVEVRSTDSPEPAVPVEKSKPTDDDHQPQKRRAPDAAIGRTLFRTVGCLVCHRVGELGGRSLFDGGDLTHVAAKRPAEFFEAWLADPARLNPRHRMPVFALSSQERKDLAAYLQTLGKPAGQARADGGNRAGKVEAGRQLVQRLRCAACHEMPGGLKPPAKLPLPAATGEKKWQNSCLAPPADRAAKPERPEYGLCNESTRAVREYLAAMSTARASPAVTRKTLPGDLVLAEWNCLSCHARDASAGIAAVTDAVIAAEPELAPLLPGMRPPSLVAVGDKLRDEALLEAIQAKNPRRPWLAVRMPRFDLSDVERSALVRHFVDNDRRPPLPSPPEKLPSDAAIRVAGGRLVTSAGFGCTSCHAIGQAVPQKVELKSRGPDLAMLGKRIRREWYDGFVRNPARVVPRMEMPSLVVPVRGVLHDDLDAQLAAVWRVLNDPDFEPPLPDPVRVVRRRNLPERPEKAAVLTDVIETADEAFTKPLVVGLSNRHNLLFDLETSSLAAWWIGDTARQGTRGKTWYWEIGGTPLWKIEPAAPELEVVSEGKSFSPTKDGQFVTEFDEVGMLPGRVVFRQRLRYELPGERELLVFVTQKFESLTEGDGPRPTAGARAVAARTGFRRTVELQIEPAGANAELRLRLVPAYVPLAVKSNRQTAELRGLAAALEVRGQSQLDDKGCVTLRPAAVGKPAPVIVDHLTSLPVDRFLDVPPPAAVVETKDLPVVPGFSATQLPLAEEIMPTGLAWRKDGTLVCCSLKGEVWLVKQAKTADGTAEERLVLFCDGLAAPYGVAANDDGSIDVINKYALLRLFDDDEDDAADRIVTLASGWGHTRDYHDWAVGLPRDPAGNYYVGLPCQQDDRSREAARLRGTALRLVPRQPTRFDPRRFSVEEICRGLRFPMGLAFNATGELFATDNQGNYNPFNELNHLQPGRHYGFINKLDFKAGARPELTEPAIDVPHPWTRSVNSIALLRTPPALAAKGERPFGPFEGHFLGCEYDTRRLVRLSLQKVGHTYQGAAYPFSVEPEKVEHGFLGPVVCEVSPAGEIYVGNMRDSGWGGGSNVGNIVRLTRSGDWPLGIAEVRAVAGGFEIDFTGAVDARAAARRENYSISLYRRVSTPAYGGPDVDRQTAQVSGVTVADDGRRVRLAVDKMNAGFVYEIRVKDLGPRGVALRPVEAFYTLRILPQSRP
ncbi:MAG: c-type cytochrome [Planctomycetia bacterium]|nr:c-type cytochrome [Planctomycetia bacterium]